MKRGLLLQSEGFHSEILCKTRRKFSFPFLYVGTGLKTVIYQTELSFGAKIVK